MEKDANHNCGSRSPFSSFFNKTFKLPRNTLWVSLQSVCVCVFLKALLLKFFFHSDILFSCMHLMLHERENFQVWWTFLLATKWINIEIDFLEQKLLSFPTFFFLPSWKESLKALQEFIAFERLFNFHTSPFFSLLLQIVLVLEKICMWSRDRKLAQKVLNSLSLKLNFTKSTTTTIHWIASFKSINLIKSDFITGSLNPCWMKFSWRRTSGEGSQRERRDFKWIMKQFMQKAFTEKSI